MVKTLRCKDFGMACDFIACGNTDEEVMEKGKMHAAEVHGKMEFSADEMQQVKSIIREEESCPVEGHSGFHGMNV
jgi:predicted small metal-binding protein